MWSYSSNCLFHLTHFEHLDELRSFDGNTAPFERSKGRLADCLKNQFKPKKRHPFIAWSLMALVVFLVGYGSFFLIRDYVRWQDYLERLHEEPGIVITEAGRKSSQYYVFGLRDPLSVDPETLLDASKLEREKVRFNWELYHSSHLMFVIRRIQTILTPPETITLEMKGQGILCAKGSATYEWLANAEKLAEAIPGILRFQSDEVSVIDQRDMELLSEKVEGGFFFFDKVAAKIKPGQEYRVEALANDIKEMDRLAQIFDKDIQIEIVGHTDSTGTDERNLQISKERAEELFSLLVSSGNRQEIFIVRGAGSKEPLREELSEEDRNFNRSVSFSVTIRDKVSDENGDTDEATAPAELAIPEISDKNGDTNEAAAPPAERGIPEEPAPDPPPATKPDGAEFGPL